MHRTAAADIAEAWVIDLNADWIEQYSQPRNGVYRLKQIVTRGELIKAHTFPAIELETAQIFR